MLLHNNCFSDFRSLEFAFFVSQNAGKYIFESEEQYPKVTLF